MKKESVNVLAVGVGGQGIIRMSDILAEVAFQSERDTKKSEIHGLSQRGGSVTSHIRWSEKVYTPVIMDGEADYLLALEKLEALRYAHMVKPEGKIIANDFIIEPATVKNGSTEIPADLEEQLSSFAELVLVPATDIAKDLGNKKASNTVMLGALSKLIDLPEEVWLQVLEKAFPEKIRELNINAFQAGRK